LTGKSAAMADPNPVIDAAAARAHPNFRIMSVPV
jgi:hypothetical protein